MVPYEHVVNLGGPLFVCKLEHFLIAVVASELIAAFGRKRTLADALRQSRPTYKNRIARPTCPTAAATSFRVICFLLIWDLVLVSQARTIVLIYLRRAVDIIDQVV
jgi:hypothetical protein